MEMEETMIILVYISSTTADSSFQIQTLLFRAHCRYMYVVASYNCRLVMLSVRRAFHEHDTSARTGIKNQDLCNICSMRSVHKMFYNLS